MSQGLFEKRRRAERWRTVRRWLLGILAVGLIAGAVWLIWFSTVLVGRRVEVEGMTTLRADTIASRPRRSVGRPVGAPRHGGDRDPGGADGTHRRATSARRWPNTVLIAVKERVPVGWVVSDGAIRYVDRNGIDFRTVPSEPENLLEIRDRNGRSAHPPAGARGRDAGRHVPAVGGRRPLRPDRIRVGGDPGLGPARLTEKRTVVWGSAEDNEEKALFSGRC